jgi:hypothetical protein
VKDFFTPSKRRCGGGFEKGGVAVIPLFVAVIPLFVAVIPLYFFFWR